MIGEFDFDGAVVEQLGGAVAGDSVHFVEALPGETNRRAALFDVEAAWSAPKAISPRPYSVIVIVAGSNEILSSRFAAVRIRPASRGREGFDVPSAGRAKKSRRNYWLSTQTQDTPADILVDTAKLRWRIERD